jgi:type IV pilus assembly protein PilW
MINHSGKFQKGLSLLELLIALTLGIFILASLIGLFVNTKGTYRLNENLARLQENGRFAISFLSRDLRLTDYKACATSDRLDDAITGVNDSGLNGSDTVTLLWQSNTCDVATAIVTTIYSIQAGASGGPALFRSVGGVDQELVEGIQDLQILYGEDTDDDFVADYYVSAASVSDMAQAISVRIRLVVRTLESNLATDGGRITRDFVSTITLRNRIP